MKKTIVIKGVIQKKNTMEYINNIPLEPVHEVIIKPWKETLSDRQRRFYWVWIDLVAKGFGYSKDECHRTMKGLYLFPIMLRAKTDVDGTFVDDYPEIVRLVEQVKAIREKGLQVEADQIARDIAKLVSITMAKVPHMGEYLDEISALAKDNNIVLPYPEERLK